MKDVITILVCNAIRKADHERNVKGAALSDEEVMAIAVQTQCDYHASEIQRFIKTYQAKSSAMASGSVVPPEDLLNAAREGLGNDFDEFLEQFGPDFSPQQLAEYADRKRASA